MPSNSVFTTLQGLLTSQAGERALQLAQNQFPGPIQTVIGDYLNGITLQLGSSASLRVEPASRQLDLRAQIDGANLDLQPTTSGATLTLSGSQYSDARVELTFAQAESGVQLTLTGTMGASLQWRLQDLWPQLLSWTPANQIQIAGGNLNLQIGANQSIDFAGRGSLLYAGQDFVNAAFSVQHTGQGTGVMFGVVVQHWSPGSIWQPLSVLTFDHSGLVVSTLSGKSGSLVSLGLLSAQDVPAVQADFDIQPGLLLFTSLQLKDSLQAITQFLGNVSQLDLFASYAKEGGDLQLKAVLSNSFSAGNKGIFEFDGFALDWDTPGQASSSISATAAGKFHPDPGTSIDVSLTGSIVPSEGDLDLTFALQHWNQPFGLSTVEIVDLQGEVEIGAQADGVTLSFAGDLKLQNPKAPQYAFEVGFEVEVVDFEVPNGIALWTQADQQPMTLSNILEAAFAQDYSPQAFQDAGEPAIAAIVQFIDHLISVQQFTFWFVEGASFQKIGNHGPFPAGFGLQAQFTLLGQEDVKVSATLTEQASAKSGFSGYVLLQQPVAWGSVFTLSGWNEDAGRPSNQGPQLAIAATPDGIVVPGVNGGKPLRFYASLYLSFLDVVHDHLYALATNDNRFELDFSVQDGQPAGGCGAWSGESIKFLLDPSQRQLSAAFGFNFGWRDIAWSGVTLWGVTLIPAIHLPDFSVAAGLGCSASLQSLIVTGYFDFSLFGLSLHLGDAGSPYTLLNVDVSKVISTLKDVAGHLLDTLKQEASALLQAALHTLDAFLQWAKAQWRNFVDGLKLVAQILKNEFQQLEAALVNLLKELGAAAADVQQIMVALGYALGEVEQWIEDVFGCPISKAANML